MGVSGLEAGFAGVFSLSFLFFWNLIYLFLSVYTKRLAHSPIVYKACVYSLIGSNPPDASIYDAVMALRLPTNM